MRRESVYVGDGRVLTRTKNGFKLFVDARDVSIAPHLVLDGVWEEWTEATLHRLVKPGMHVVEIGANVGYFTLLMARLTGASGTVQAFECDPRLAQIARDNLELNGLSKIAHLDERAVSDTEGSLRFFTAERHRGGGTLVAGLEQIPELTSAERREIEVQATTLDALARERDRRIDLLKIDAEGAETAIIRGGHSIIADRSHPMTVIVEYCPAFVSRAGEDPRAYLEQLAAWGFTIERIDERRRKPVRTCAAELLASAYSELVLRR